MKKSWIYFSLLPIAAFCQNNADDLFYTEQQIETNFLNIAFEDEEELSSLYAQIQESDFDEEGISLFEMEKNDLDENFLPWSKVEVAVEEVHSHLERQVKRIPKENKDVFSYKKFDHVQRSQYQPSFENVPQSGRSLLGRGMNWGDQSKEKNENLQSQLSKSDSQCPVRRPRMVDR